MRLPRLLCCVVALAAALLSSCSKSPAGGGGNALAEVDVLDASKFRPAFENSSPEVKAQVNQIMLAIGSSDYVGAMTQIESLTNAPGITDAQKKITADLSQQLQKKIAATPPPAQ
jgi:hypothetical protein